MIQAIEGEIHAGGKKAGQSGRSFEAECHKYAALLWYLCVACTAASLAATLRLCGRTAIARVCKVLGCSADGLEMLSGLQLVRMVMKKGKLRPTTGHGEVDKLVVRKCQEAHTHEVGCHQVGG